MNKELFEKAKAAKSPEELLNLAHESGMKDFTEENAKAYFESMHKSGELSDDELEHAAGGCKRGGRTVVTILNHCDHWRCDACNRYSQPTRYELEPRSHYLPEYALYGCNKGKGETDKYASLVFHTRDCQNCYYCSYEGGMWYCNNSVHNKE